MLTETSPRHDADGDGDGSTSWPCLPLAPCASIFSRSWRPVPSCLALWVTWAPQEWPVVAMGHVEACPFPSSVRSLTPDSSFFVHSSKGSADPMGPAPLPEGDRASSGSGRTELPSWGQAWRGSFLRGRARRGPLKGLNEQNLCPTDWVNQNLSPRGRAKPRSRPLIVCLILIVRDR
jgi:hypothetical protein